MHHLNLLPLFSSSYWTKLTIRIVLGLHERAARNFHSATIYFRVLESLMPQMTAQIDGKLRYAAQMTRQYSHLLENFVHEHFDGESFHDVYTLLEDQKLGEGGYGSVYQCTHKRIKDIYACKIVNLNRINSYYLRKLHLEIAIMKGYTCS